MKRIFEEAMCAYCEWATVQKDETLFCKKKRKEVAAEGICRCFSYDLLKRPASPKPSIVAIDPSLFE